MNRNASAARRAWGRHGRGWVLGASKAACPGDRPFRRGQEADYGSGNMADSSKTTQEKIEKVAELIEDITIAMFTTTDDGSPHLHSRPMAIRGGLDGGSLYFFTYKDSNKVDEFKQDRQVNVSFSDHASNKYVSIAGVAKLVHDRGIMEEKWTPELNTWFGEGLDTPGITLIRVDATEAQYWHSKSQILLHAYGTVKALITGEPVKDAGENDVVTFPQA